MAKYISGVKGKSTKSIKNPFTEKNKNIVIRFDNIFEDEELNVYNTFVMSIGKKRVYSNFAPSIVKDNNKILSLDANVSNHVMYSYFTIKRAIDNKMFAKVDSEKDLTNYGVEARRDFGKYVSFIDFMVSTLFRENFINLIKDYVNKNYIPVDESKSADYASGTTFTNEHFKILHTISIMSKFAIPLCTHYIFINSDKNIEVYNFMYTVFDALFKVATVGTSCKNLMDKLYQFVDRIVRRTESSNKLIWKTFPMYNETRESIVEDLVIKLVTTILPKFDLQRSIIALIAVVARDSVGSYKIKAKHPYDCFSINDNDRSNDDEDALSETDIFDMFYRSTDENIIVLNRIGNDASIERIARRNNVVLNPMEIDYYMKHYELHNFTVTVVSLVFARFFSGVENVKSCNFEQFIKLMIILVKKMKDLDINYLPKFVTAKRVSYSFNRMPSAMILKNLKNDYDYNQLIDMKYKNVASVFDIKTSSADDRNPIKDMIISLVHNNYELNEYGSKDNGTPLVVDEEKLIKDVIQLHKKMII